MKKMKKKRMKKEVGSVEAMAKSKKYVDVFLFDDLCNICLIIAYCKKD